MTMNSGNPRTLSAQFRLLHLLVFVGFCCLVFAIARIATLLPAAPIGWRYTLAGIATLAALVFLLADLELQVHRKRPVAGRFLWWIAGLGIAAGIFIWQVGRHLTNI